MTDVTLQTQAEAANAYEALFVPALFGQWAPKVSDAARIQPRQQVLDVACGTGILAREVASRVGATGYVAGLDPSPGMLEVARRLAPAIDWTQGTADSLPFADECFHGVVSQFGLMFFPDPVRSLREMCRVLNSEGHLAVAVWDKLENMPAFAEEVALLERVAGTEAANALRAPFSLGNKDELLRIAQDAGVSSAEVNTYDGRASFPSIRSLVEADLRGWLPVMGVNLEEATIRRILAEAESALKHHVNAGDEAVFRISAHILSGTKP